MKNQKLAMTLVELCVVLIITAIIVSLSLPLFTKTIEKTKGKEAKVALDQIWAGERIYRTEQGHFFPKSNATESTIATINSFLRTDIDKTAKRRWNYQVQSVTDDTFTATATRIGGNYNGKTRTIDEDGARGGTFSP